MLVERMFARVRFPDVGEVAFAVGSVSGEVAARLGEAEIAVGAAFVD
jgi:hypothetical protein